MCLKLLGHQKAQDYQYIIQIIIILYSYIAIVHRRQNIPILRII